MRVKIEAGKACGEVVAPPSKSVSHRMLICAALAKGVSRISGISLCDDVIATADCLRSLGARIEFSGNEVTVWGFDPFASAPTEPLFAKESGSTLRFLIPIAYLSDKEISFGGAPRLMERPLSVYEGIAKDLCLEFKRECGRIILRGPLKTKEYSVRGDVSSQFITGLLFALPFLGGGRIDITGKIESRSYIDLTLFAMREFGINTFWDGNSSITVEGGDYVAKSTAIEGDYSATAFIDALSYLGGDARALGLNEGSMQGDRVYKEHFRSLSEGSPKISIEDCPDLAPILFALAAALNGAEFTDTARLKFKESDRAEVMREELSKFGASLEIRENSVLVKKVSLHTPSEVLLGHNDHRIVMALSVLCTRFGGEINGAEAISKSYPEFFEHLKSLNIKVQQYADQ